MVLMIDNYDSFTYNLVLYFQELGAQVKVYKNDHIGLADIHRLAPSHIVLSLAPAPLTKPAFASPCCRPLLAKFRYWGFA